MMKSSPRLRSVFHACKSLAMLAPVALAIAFAEVVLVEGTPSLRSSDPTPENPVKEYLSDHMYDHTGVRAGVSATSTVPC